MELNYKNNLRVVVTRVLLFLSVTFLVFLVSISPVFAQHEFGAGIIIGDPTGLSFNYELSKENSVDAALAWSGSINLILQADYLWHRQKLFYLDNYPVDWYFGVGGRLRDRDDHHYHGDDDGMQLGVRAPAGLRFMFHDPRIEVFTEVSLIMNLIPETDADIDIGIGARYYF